MDAFVPEVAPPPLLECRDLTKRYGATVALDRFTVSLAAGRIVGLLGPNGSGKTTLLKMIAGVAHPTAGDIRVAGYEVGPESKALVSYLPERPYFSRSMRVREMIAFFADFYEDFDAALARDMLARLGVPEGAPCAALSKGTVEKVQLTLVMARHAALYLLDEPIGGVDPAARDYILQRLFARIGRSRPSSFPPTSCATWRRFWTTSSCCAMARCFCTHPWPT
ncbi:MAG: ATP-binding cassette domain-containing protein [Coriobacteriaceae bacterium]